MNRASHAEAPPGDHGGALASRGSWSLGAGAGAVELMEG